MTHNEFDCAVDKVLGEIGDLLKSKNRAYGNSALDPVRVFSKASTSEQLRVRLDDKLSRLARGSAAGEDVETDLMGYLVLLRIAERPAWHDRHMVAAADPIKVGDIVRIVEPDPPENEGCNAERLGLVGRVDRVEDGEDGYGYRICSGRDRLWVHKVERVPAWVVPFAERDGWYAYADGKTAGPKASQAEAVAMLALTDRSAVRVFEVRT
jgi:hypothetical protein